MTIGAQFTSGLTFVTLSLALLLLRAEASPFDVSSCGSGFTNFSSFDMYFPAASCGTNSSVCATARATCEATTTGCTGLNLCLTAYLRCVEPLSDNANLVAACPQIATLRQNLLALAAGITVYSGSPLEKGCFNAVCAMVSNYQQQCAGVSYNNFCVAPTWTTAPTAVPTPSPTTSTGLPVAGPTLARIAFTLAIKGTGFAAMLADPVGKAKLMTAVANDLAALLQVLLSAILIRKLSLGSLIVDFQVDTSVATTVTALGLATTLQNAQGSGNFLAGTTAVYTAAGNTDSLSLTSVASTQVYQDQMYLTFRDAGGKSAPAWGKANFGASLQSALQTDFANACAADGAVASDFSLGSLTDVADPSTGARVVGVLTLYGLSLASVQGRHVTLSTTTALPTATALLAAAVPGASMTSIEGNALTAWPSSSTTCGPACVIAVVIGVVLGVTVALGVGLGCYFSRRAAQARGEGQKEGEAVASSGEHEPVHDEGERHHKKNHRNV